MFHSYYKIWLHVVFSAKDREPYLGSNTENVAFNYIKDQSIELGCNLGSAPNHVHFLIQQNSNKSIVEAIKPIKEASSYWVNQSNFFSFKFFWQINYGVSESQICISGKKRNDQKQIFQRSTILS